MTEENTLNIESSLGFGDEPVEKPKRRKRTQPVEVEEVVVEEPVAEEPVVEEPVVEEPVDEPKVEEPAPVAKPWKPLVRPMRPKIRNSVVNRGEMRRTR